MSSSCWTVPSCRFPSKSAIQSSLILSYGTRNRSDNQSYSHMFLDYHEIIRPLLYTMPNFCPFQADFFLPILCEKCTLPHQSPSATLSLTELSVMRTYGCGFSHMRLRNAPHSFSHFCFFSLTGSSFQARSSAASLTQNARMHDFI